MDTLQVGERFPNELMVIEQMRVTKKNTNQYIGGIAGNCVNSTLYIIYINTLKL